MTDDLSPKPENTPPAAGIATPPSVPGTPSPVPEHRATLVDEIKQTADKLAADGATRGDLKILSRVLRELRYAFKVFTPYRRRFKVTVFGSARTARDDGAYKQSVEFGRQMAQAGWMVVTGVAAASWKGPMSAPARKWRWASTSCSPLSKSRTPSSRTTKNSCTSSIFSPASCFL